MNETALSNIDNEQSILELNYMDWSELTYTKPIKSAYYFKNTDDYSDLLENQEIYRFNK